MDQVGIDVNNDISSKCKAKICEKHKHEWDYMTAWEQADKYGDHYLFMCCKKCVCMKRERAHWVD